MNQSETKSTLMFGQRARAIKNVTEINVRLSSDELKRQNEALVKENKKLVDFKEKLLQELDIWRSGNFNCFIISLTAIR